MASKRSRLRRLLLASTAFVSIFASSLAYAEPTTADKDRARELMAQGREQRDSVKDLAAALKAFTAANDIMHVPTTAYEVARTQQAMNLLLEAHDTVVALRALPPSPSDPPQFQEARSKAEVLDKELTNQTPSLKIVVTSSDPKVTPTVTVDDHPITLDAPRKVNPGKHSVIARGGGAEASATPDVKPGEQNKLVELRLEAKTIVTPPTEKPRGGVPLISWIGFGVGGAGLVVGSITGILALSKEGDISENCPNKQCERKFEGDLDSANTMATISTIGFIVAGVGAAVGVVGILTRPTVSTTPGSDTRSSSSSSPPIKVRFAGNGLVGTF